MALIHICELPVHVAASGMIFPVINIVVKGIAAMSVCICTHSVCDPRRRHRRSAARGEALSASGLEHVYVSEISIQPSLG